MSASYGIVKAIGNGRVDVQTTGSARVLRNVRVSAQVNWNLLTIGTRVLIDYVDSQPIVLHTIVDVPHTYQNEDLQYVNTQGVFGGLEGALLADGSVSLTGDLVVSPGVTIDGYDISTLGQTIDNLQAADSVARTGYTVMTHASQLVESISSSATDILIRHGIFQVDETLALSNTASQIEFMKVTAGPTATVDNRGALCYAYTVQRRIWTSPTGLTSGWAAATLVSGLTLQGYIAFDNRQGTAGAPSMRFVLHTDIPNNQTEQIVRVGSLNGISGFDQNDYGFAFGRLTTGDRLMSYSYHDDMLRLRGADILIKDNSGRQVFRIWGTEGDGHIPGDYQAGPDDGGRQVWDGLAGKMSFYNGTQPVLSFDAFQSLFEGMIWSGTAGGPRIGIGSIGGDGEIVARNASDAVQFLVRTRSSEEGVYLFAGNPKPQGNWLEMDNGVLTYDGTIRARVVELLGSMVFEEGDSPGGSVPEIIIQDPDDPRQYGHIKPKYLAGYSVDHTDFPYLSMLQAWAPVSIEVVPGSGVIQDFLAGEAFYGHRLRSHLRIERNRVGFFYGETPISWMDDSGNFNASGGFTWANGKGIADATGLSHTEDASNYLNIKPDDYVFLEVRSNKSGGHVSILGAGVNGYGVNGTVSGSGGTGVYGVATDSGGVGVVAQNLSSGDAFHAIGISKLGDGGATNYAQFNATGMLTFYGSAGLNMNSRTITSVSDPINAQDVATKNYVDTSSPGSGLSQAQILARGMGA